VRKKIIIFLVFFAGFFCKSASACEDCCCVCDKGKDYYFSDSENKNNVHKKYHKRRKETDTRYEHSNNNPDNPIIDKPKFKKEKSTKVPHHYKRTITRLCRQYDVDKALVLAVVKNESGFDPNAVSPKGAIGLMQLMPGTSRDLGVENPFHPVQNLDGGIRHLRHLLDRYQGNVRLVLVAYRNGENSFSVASGNFYHDPGTHEYVERVLHSLKHFRK